MITDENECIRPTGMRGFEVGVRHAERGQIRKSADLPTAKTTF
ncbi:MAG: hypothetical protein [Olavius algarvensis Delta 4 endosymbiont]|nr:MAG: hypothetical protein [Olavius algarvensis Delta 4 endosymbiont]